MSSTWCENAGIPALCCHAVLLSTAFLKRVRHYGADSWLLPLCLDASARDRLCAFLSGSFVRDTSGRAVLSSIQAGGWVRFYHARGAYWGLQTCNTWVAQALRSAGFAVPQHGIVLAEQLFAQVRRYRCSVVR